MISIRTHGITDYIFGILLVACPSIFGMSEIPSAKGVFFASGLLILLTAIFTCKFISIRAHMKLDLAVGIFLIISPSIFSYRHLLSSTQYEVQVMLGFLVILFVGETRYRHEDSIAGPKIMLDVGHFLSKSG